MIAVVEASVIEKLQATLESNSKLIESLFNENKALKNKKLYSIKEVADMVGLKPNTILAHISEFEYVSTGKNKLITAPSVDKWIAANTIKPKIKASR